MDSARLSVSDRYNNIARFRRLLTEAQTLDEILVIWANALPTENWNITRTVQEDGRIESGSRVFHGTVHIYTTVGHAGMWKRYRALRLTVNDIMLQTLSVLTASPVVKNFFERSCQVENSALHVRIK